MSTSDARRSARLVEYVPVARSAALDSLDGRPSSGSLHVNFRGNYFAFTGQTRGLSMRNQWSLLGAPPATNKRPYNKKDT